MLVLVLKDSLRTSVVLDLVLVLASKVLVLVLVLVPQVLVLVLVLVTKVLVLVLVVEIRVLEYVRKFAIFNLRDTCFEVQECTFLLYNFTAPTSVLDILHASRASISAQWPHSQASSCENK